jgi:hypothetical protein
MRIGKHHVVALAAAAALVVGAAAAFAAGGPPPGGGQRGAGNGVMAGGVVKDATADYIGVTEAALAVERHEGKSLAQIAVAHGKTVAGLKAALTTAFKAHLDELVSAGRITTVQATQALAHFQSRLQAIVDRVETGPGMGRGPVAGVGLGAGNGSCRNP